MPNPSLSESCNLIDDRCVLTVKSMTLDRDEEIKRLRAGLFNLSQWPHFPTTEAMGEYARKILGETT